MSPVELLLWVFVICVSIIFIGVTVVVLIGAIQGMLRKGTERSERDAGSR